MINNELHVKNLTKEFSEKENSFVVFKDANLVFKTNEISFICGRSGSGKTTLLTILGGLSLPTSGEISFNGNEYFSSKDNLNKLDILRSQFVSFVFQDFNLISDFTSLDNLLITGCSKEEALNILNIIGLKDKEKLRAKFLSGGEKQRLAIGRALAKNSKIILLDEPSANLDIENSTNVFNLLKKISKDRIIIVASHDIEIINKFADKCFIFENGSIKEKNIINNRLIKFNKLNLDSEQFFNFIINLSNLKPKVLILRSDKSENIYSIDYKNFYNFIKKTFSKYKDKDISIELKYDYDNFDFTNIKNNVNKKPDFNIQLKYISSIFRSRTFLIMSSFFCLLLSCLFYGGVWSLSTYNLGNALNKSFNASQIEYSAINEKKYNENLMEYTTINSGKKLYNELMDDGVDSYLTFDTTINNSEKITLFVLDKKISFSNKIIEPKDNEVILTSFEKNQLSSIEKANLSIDKYSINFEANLSYLDDYIEPEVAKNYRENNLNSYQKDIVNEKYKVGFISKNFLLKQFEQYKTFFDFAPFVNESIQKDEPKKNVQYIKEIDNIEISYGSKDIKNNEVIVSENFIKSNLKYMNYFNDYNDMIGFELKSFNTNESVNFVNYLEVFNMADLSDKFIIKGIAKSQYNESFIVLSDDLWNIYAKEHINYSSNVKIELTNDNVKKLSRSRDFTILTNVTTRVYAFYDFTNGTFRSVLISLLVLFGFLISFLSLNLFRLLYNDKIKELFVLLVIGIKKGILINSLIILCILVEVCAMIFGNIFGQISIVIVNAILNTKNLLNLNFGFLSYDWCSLLISAIILLLCLVISSVVIYKKINKKDYSEEIKKFTN